MNADIETVVSEWDVVYTLAWDSGAPGPGAGVEFIYKSEGKYVAILEGDLIGPCDNLVDVLDQSELNLVLSGVTNIECSEMSSEELAAVLHSHNDPGFQLLINREKWELGLAQKFLHAT